LAYFSGVEFLPILKQVNLNPDIRRGENKYNPNICHIHYQSNDIIYEGNFFAFYNLPRIENFFYYLLL
jgi:hypothetical protein